MTEVMERYKPEMVTAHDGVLYIRFVPDDAGAWVMHHQATALQARVAELEKALRKIEYLDRPQIRGLPRRVSIQEIALAVLEGKK